VIAVDTNILVYAHREDSPFHATAFQCVALRALLVAGRVAGPLVHDARVAALCRQHGVRELWSADRDFGRFAGFPVVNPLVRGTSQ
jgi:predicted nucleic acid-binding protein